MKKEWLRRELYQFDRHLKKVSLYQHLLCSELSPQGLDGPREKRGDGYLQSLPLGAT